MNTPEERPKPEKPILDLPSMREVADKLEKDSKKPVLDLPDMNEVADRLFNEGKISNMQAAQLKMWYSVRPDINANRAKYEAWKKVIPVDVPGLFTENTADDRPVPEKPVLDLPSIREVADKLEKDSKKPTLDLPDMNEVADKLFEQGKISNMQAAQLKMWYSVRPDIDTNSAKYIAWKKSIPVDVPGLFTE